MPPTPTHQIVHSDSLRHLRSLPENSVDAIVTDPPYGLSNVSPRKVTEALTRWVSDDRGFIPAGRGFMSQEWDSFVPPPALWDECLRVLKPGGHLAAFAGSRTQDLMGLSIRLAGFELRDGLIWLYGSGMPHGQDVERATEKEVARSGAQRAGADPSGWAGWSTTLKPAQEPIILARKPLSETSVARNVLTHGVGALNTGATSIAFRSAADLQESTEKNQHAAFGTIPGTNNVYGDYTMVAAKDYDGAGGRHPANVLLTHETGCELRGQRPATSNSHHPAAMGAGGIGSSGHSGRQEGLLERRPGHEIAEDWDCTPGCPVAVLDGQAPPVRFRKDVGGPSRFFYTTPAEDVGFLYSPKAPSRERPAYVDDEGEAVRHVSVKPLRIMRWLVRLLTPAGGLVLDPFAGSGTTLEAAMLEGFDSVVIEREAEFIPLIQQRLDRALGGRAA